jgi:two-component system alkaline phosphatase synthesis response regulator PhoP
MNDIKRLDLDIVVADDEPHITHALNFIFKKEGYKVAMAFDGVSALNLVKQQKPKIMFLDLIMPKKNGDEICKAIKSDSELQDIYVIVLTAKGQELDKRISMSAGADEFITKPFSPKEVVERVKVIIGK